MKQNYIIFTDLKDFTYKNSLLTDKQITEILEDFHQIVSQAAEKYNVKIIKSIGDAYFSISENVSDAYGFSQAIIEQSQVNDTKQKIDLKKISLRVTITYGSITQNHSLDLEDYFGEAINLGARIMDITPAGNIFCTRDVQEKLWTNTYIKYIGDFSFHGVLMDIPLYSLTPIDDEKIELLKQREDSVLKECEDVVFRSSCVAAILSVQPIPFLENFNLVAVHLYMIVRISQKFESGLSLKDSSLVFKNLIAPLGLSYAAFQGSTTAVKILLPGIGGYLFAPVIFAVSYALGKLYISYFYYQSSGEVLTPDMIRELFAKYKVEGKKLAKERKKDIIHIGKKYSSEVMSLKKEKSFSKVQNDTIKMLKNNS